MIMAFSTTGSGTMHSHPGTVDTRAEGIHHAIRVVGRISARTLLALLFVCIGGMPARAADKPSPGNANGRVVVVKGSDFSVRIDPDPAWVVSQKIESGPKPPGSSMYFAAIDNQIRVTASDVEKYVRVVRVVSESGGLGPAAQFIASFDPSYERLRLHRLGIWRDGRFLDRLNAKKIALLHRETRLEYRVYDGQVTASANIEDLRVGDQVEYAYTVQGMNPVFEGRVSHTVWAIAESGPIVAFRTRLLVPAGRNIRFRAGPDVRVATSERGGTTETVFERRNIAQFRYDPSAPDSVFLEHQIQISEFSGWNDVARWGERLFRDAGRSSVAVRRKAEGIEAAASKGEDRLRMALDFVQNEVRYFGVEIGSGSHRPAEPDRVLEQRYGDCKDKTSLLIGLLREMGISAAPVLVSARLQDAVTDVLPGPSAFDHVIARVELDGRIYWLDGTRSHQTGPISERQSSGFSKGLLLGASSEDLAPLPDAASLDRVSVHETIRVADFQDAPSLESRITYFGELAEYMRQAYSTQPVDQFESQFSADYARMYNGIRRVAPLRVEEVPGRNAVRVVQNFVLQNFWAFPEERLLTGEVALWGIMQAVKFPEELSRKTALRIQWPGVHRHETVIEYPEDVARAPSSSRFDDGGGVFTFTVEYRTEPRRTSVSAELRLTAANVPPGEWGALTAKLRGLRPRFGSNFNVPAITLAQAEKLPESLRAMEDELRRGRISPRPVTRVQVDARFREVLLTAQLQSGRLNSALRAQALRQRGVQRDNMGMLQKAAEDFAEALRLDPGGPKLLLA
ncbi:MAG TPA: DUF3857 domain-containing protein, partial [Rhodocyclaceae bacterium]|nr:DUF3857 domain-containing protein [Rhodocyclaceae bacterium]